MKLSDIGGEFAFINRVTGKAYNDPAVVKGVGDDCAVLDYTAGSYLLVTTDMMVENTHFALRWFTPYQVGKKLMEVNVSDIVAMGGTPRWAFISMSLSADTQVEFMDEFYRGLYESAGAHGIALLGGDTTRGNDLVFNLALLGDVEKNLLCLRSGAVPGDRICVTGTLGKSEAGLVLLHNDRRGYIDGYLEPCSRLVAEGKAIARYAHAMIDVSDGLASEVKHICQESGTGACIEWERIPLSSKTIEAAKAVGSDPYKYALYGGEDFELVFTMPEQSIPQLKNEFSDFTVVGEVLPHEQGIYILKEGKTIDIEKGYDHFF